MQSVCNGRRAGGEEGRAGEMEGGKESVCLCEPVVVPKAVLPPSVG